MLLYCFFHMDSEDKVPICHFACCSFSNLILVHPTGVLVRCMTNGSPMKSVFVRLLAYQRSTWNCQMTEKYAHVSLISIVLVGYAHFLSLNNIIVLGCCYCYCYLVASMHVSCWIKCLSRECVCAWLKSRSRAYVLEHIRRQLVAFQCISLGAKLVVILSLRLVAQGTHESLCLFPYQLVQSLWVKLLTFS